MTNPFRLRWLQGWTFQVMFMEGDVQVEAQGFGIRLRTAVQQGESPQTAADRLVLAEDQRRRALHHAWLRGQSVAQPLDPDSCEPSLNADADLTSLVVVGTVGKASGRLSAQVFSHQARMNPAPPQRNPVQKAVPQTDGISQPWISISKMR